MANTMVIDEDTGLDLNDGGAGGTSKTFNVEDFKRFTCYFKSVTGTFATAVVDIECSFDDVIWFKITDSADAAKITSGNHVLVPDIEIDVRYCRCNVSTPEGSAATFDFHVQGKK